MTEGRATRHRPGNASHRRERRKALFEKQGGLCHWCAEPMQLTGAKAGIPPKKYATLEHLLPHSLGGTWGRANIVLACAKCNFARSNSMDPPVCAAPPNSQGESA